MLWYRGNWVNAALWLAAAIAWQRQLKSSQMLSQKDPKSRHWSHYPYVCNWSVRVCGFDFMSDWKAQERLLDNSGKLTGLGSSQVSHPCRTTLHNSHQGESHWLIVFNAQRFDAVFIVYNQRTRTYITTSTGFRATSISMWLLSLMMSEVFIATLLIVSGANRGLMM